ncbi:hypothetical protein F4811DRAFT_514523 [Daldinia bambusicola]|nr:hypothetical protein F4811DRAFT_514523 [Daldinia bambusicola]
MEGVCQKVATHYIPSRRPGPGSECPFGYDSTFSSESQIKLLKVWRRQDKDSNSTPAIDAENEAQGMAGIVWNLMKSKFPPEIIADFNDTIRKSDLPRMDMMKDDETFTFEVGSEDVTFETGENGLELPPPSATATVNRAGETETEDWYANSWVASYTVNAPEDHTKGGNFYLASYGILVLAASNTATAWRHLDFHGTTLYEMEPGPEERPGREIRKDGNLNTGFQFEIALALKLARKNSHWLDERRKGKVAKATSPKASSPKARSPKAQSAKVVHTPKSGLPETKMSASSCQYSLRPRSSIPNYYESDLELFTDTESTAVESGYQTETETDWTGTETETRVGSGSGSGSGTGPELKSSAIYHSYGSLSIIPKLH